MFLPIHSIYIYTAGLYPKTFFNFQIYTLMSKLILYKALRLNLSSLHTILLNYTTNYQLSIVRVAF